MTLPIPDRPAHLGVPTPGMGFAGVRTGFGSLTTRDGVLPHLRPGTTTAACPRGDLVMRMIGHLGSHLDSADPAGSAPGWPPFHVRVDRPRFRGHHPNPAAVSDPNLIPNLIARGSPSPGRSPANCSGWPDLKSPPPRRSWSNIATSVIRLVQSRAWGAIPR